MCVRIYEIDIKVSSIAENVTGMFTQFFECKIIKFSICKKLLSNSFFLKKIQIHCHQY